MVPRSNGPRPWRWFASLPGSFLATAHHYVSGSSPDLPSLPLTGLRTPSWPPTRGGVLLCLHANVSPKAAAKA